MAWLYQPLLPAAAEQTADGGGTYVLDAEAAGFAYAGQAVGFSRNYAIAAGPGLFVLNGGDAAFGDGNELPSEIIGSLTLGFTLGL